MSDQNLEHMMEMNRVEVMIETDHHKLPTNGEFSGLSKGQFRIIVITFGVIFFKLLDLILDFVINKYDSSQLTQTLKKKDMAKHRFKNYFMSLIHSTTSSLWAFLCLYCDPYAGQDDLINFSTISVALICFSTGYFLHDSYHIIANDRSRGSLEIIPHHITVAGSFFMLLYMERIVMLGVIALIVEFNSIFLHIRMLMKIGEYPRDSRFYKVNRVVNIATYIVFRVGTIGWMIQWLLRHSSSMPLVPYCFITFSTFANFGTNARMLYRLIQSDFLNTNKSRSEHRKEG